MNKNIQCKIFEENTKFDLEKAINTFISSDSIIVENILQSSKHNATTVSIWYSIKEITDE